MDSRGRGMSEGNLPEGNGWAKAGVEPLAVIGLLSLLAQVAFSCWPF